MTASDEDAEAGSSELSAKDLKKLRSKQRRAEKKAQESKKGEIPQARKCLYLPLSYVAFFLWKTIKEAKLFVTLHKKHTAGRNVGLFQHFLLPAVPQSIL